MKIVIPGIQDPKTNRSLWAIAITNLACMTIGRFLGEWWLGSTINKTIGWCLFRAITGHYCPLCGMTRAYTAAMHGDWELSLFENPMGIVLIASGIFILCWQLINTGLKYHFRSGFWASFARIIGILLLVNWLVLLIIK